MSSTAQAGVTVLVTCDPGMPTRRFRSVQNRFEAQVRERYGPASSVHVRSGLVKIGPDGGLRLASVAALREEYSHVDAMVVLTEMPRRSAKRMVVAEVYPDDDLAACFWPTLGVLARDAQVVDVVAECVERLVPSGTAEAHLHGRHRFRWTLGASSGLPVLRAHAIGGWIRTMIGMVVTNAPWRTLPKLSSAMAAGLAAGAFGIFFSSIWSMAAALSTERLLLIGFLAIMAMTAWLMFSNRLWERPSPRGRSGLTVVYNLSTVLTLFLCVLALYVALVVVILTGTLIVIAPEYMSTVLGEDARFTHYTGIAWLSAAMGVLAGGLGSSFDSETEVRQLTHGQRERRRALDD